MGDGTDAMRPQPELGLLFVHGIGGQRQGDTLVQWGDAVAKWLQDWGRESTSQPDVGADSKPQVRFCSASLHPPDAEPAHGILEIRDGGNNVRQTRRIGQQAGREPKDEECGQCRP